MVQGSFTNRKVNTYAYLRAVSWYAYDLANKDEVGCYNHLITSMLFSAFCLEAFLNHVGHDKIPFWDDLQKSLSPQNKVKVISQILVFQPDYSKRPFQTFGDIFKLRNNLVHAETIEIENGYQLSNGSATPIEILSKWEEHITFKYAKRFLDDTKEMIQEIAHAAKYNPEIVLDFPRPRSITNFFGPSSIVSS